MSPGVTRSFPNAKTAIRYCAPGTRDNPLRVAARVSPETTICAVIGASGTGVIRIKNDRACGAAVHWTFTCCGVTMELVICGAASVELASIRNRAVTDPPVRGTSALYSPVIAATVESAHQARLAAIPGGLIGPHLSAFPPFQPAGPRMAGEPLTIARSTRKAVPTSPRSRSR